MTEQEKLLPMKLKHAHVELAEAQRVQRTLLCPGPCPHMFAGVEENQEVYGKVEKGEIFEYYDELLGLTRMKRRRKDRRLYAALLAAAEKYTKMMLRIWIEECGLRTFKDQDGVYQEWGPPGDFLMMRIVDYVHYLEKKYGIKILYLHDCKRGDLSATQSGYFGRFLDDLFDKLGIKFAFFNYDAMNINVYMGKDVAMLEEAKKKNVIPARGLKLMREKGKGIVILDSTSNDSGADYQKLYVPKRRKTVEQCIAEDTNKWSEQYGLINDGLSALGLVVGVSKHKATGILRRLFPTATDWVPGFGNQSGRFENIMLELIREGKWNGQGAIFGSETAMMYVWMEKFGGTNRRHDAEKCAVSACNNFRRAEFEAYQTSEVKLAGIVYPFQLVA